jgi:hypothetical protein
MLSGMRMARRAWTWSPRIRTNSVCGLRYAHTHTHTHTHSHSHSHTHRVCELSTTCCVAVTKARYFVY